MLICQYKRTPMAMAPEAISEVINKYTDHHSYVVGYGYPVAKIIPHTSLVHQHNIDEVDFHRKLVQYHSEPFRVNLLTPITKLVIAQYHATLPEYKDCTVVRNPIDIYNKYYIPKYVSDKVRIGYSPSTLKPGTKWADKGYIRTIPILQGIKDKYGDLVEIDIITGVSLDECLNRKSKVNIFIDEVVTPSYHRSGLESLGMGVATICSLGTAVEEIFLKSSGADHSPFINIDINGLFGALDDLIQGGVELILNKGYASRIWMERYWHPSNVSSEYVNAYSKVMRDPN
jgi:hypothetical protein